MLRRTYLLNVVVSALGTIFCMAMTPTPDQVFGAVRQSLEAAALDSALLGPVVFRTVTLYSR